MKRHLIWDWNGTLLNDTWLCHELDNEELTRRGLPQITLDQFRDHFTIPIGEFYRRIGMPVEEAELHALGRSFHQRYENRRAECGLHTGAHELLSEIQGLGFSQSILSFLPIELLTAAVAEYSLGHFFSDVVGREEMTAAGKVETALRWMEEREDDGSHFVMIGDTTHDHEVSEALGIDCILIAHGFQSEAVLRRCGVPVVRSISELRRTLIDSE